MKTQIWKRKNAPSKSISPHCVLLEGGTVSWLLRGHFVRNKRQQQQKASLTASVFRIGRNLDVKHIGRIIWKWVYFHCCISFPEKWPLKSIFNTQWGEPLSVSHGQSMMDDKHIPNFSPIIQRRPNWAHYYVLARFFFIEKPKQYCV